MSRNAKKLLYGCKNGNLGWVETALAAGESPDICNAEGKPGLLVAAGAGHGPVCLALLEAGADAGLWDAALQAARDAGHDAAVEALAGWSPPPAADGLNLLEQTEVFEKAVRKGDLARVREILETGYDHQTILGSGPMCKAVASANVELMELLHAHGAQLEQKGRASSLTWAPSLHPDLVERLLSWGADPKHPDGSRQTPLHAACADGNDAVATLLLAAGASVEAKDGEGRTAMDLAILRGKNPDLMGTLVAAGAKISRKTTKSFCSGVYAERGQEMLAVIAKAAPRTLTSAALVAALRTGRVRIAYALIDQGLRAVDWAARPSFRALADVAAIPHKLGPVGALADGESLWHCAFSALFGRPVSVTPAVVEGVEDGVDVYTFMAPGGGFYILADASPALLLHTLEPAPSLASLLANMASGAESFSPGDGVVPSLTELLPLVFGHVLIADERVDIWQFVGLTPDEAQTAGELGLPTVEAAWLRDGLGRIYRPERATSNGLAELAGTLRAGLSELDGTCLRETAPLVQSILRGEMSNDTTLDSRDADRVLSALASTLPHPVQLLRLLAATAESTSSDRRTAAERALWLPLDHPWGQACQDEARSVLDTS